jgi:hypothetical protein
MLGPRCVDPNPADYTPEKFVQAAAVTTLREDDTNNQSQRNYSDSTISAGLKNRELNRKHASTLLERTGGYLSGRLCLSPVTHVRLPLA